MLFPSSRATPFPVWTNLVHAQRQLAAEDFFASSGLIEEDAMVLTAEETTTGLAVGIDRRVWIRYGSNLEAVCCTPDSRRQAGWSARVRDVSRGGVGLVLRHRFRPGTRLLVEMRDRGGTVRYIAARVVHARPLMEDGQPAWFLGCAFGIDLSDEELQQLV